MNERIELLLKRIKELQDELHLELTKLSERFHYTVEKRRVIFERDVEEYHRRLKKNLFRYILNSNTLVALVSPVIYIMIIPLVLLDLGLTIYQTVCFPVYKIKKVPRADFIVVDRHYLQYLNLLERFNCAYCGYANGLFAYAREIGARTENYWCPIKHARRIRQEHSHYAGFEEYGDADGFRARMKKLSEQNED
jgi:hypothetical protein